MSCIVIQYEYKVPNTHADLPPLPHSPWMILLLASRHWNSTSTLVPLATRLNTKRVMATSTSTCKTVLSRERPSVTDSAC